MIIIYLAAIVAANLSIVYFGPSMTVINAFVFIGLDLTARDVLHDRWTKNLWPKMLILIGAGSLLSFTLNRNAGSIAVASFVAFLIAGISDTAIYRMLQNRPRYIRINISNVISSIVDSMLFLTIAFGWPPIWIIFAGQVLAKIFGGFIWSIVIMRKFNERP